MRLLWEVYSLRFRQSMFQRGSGSVNYRENAAIAAHARRISGDRKDNSHILLYQVYQSACEPAVFFSNRMASVSRVSGVSGVLGIMEQIPSKLLHLILELQSLF
jgi:predicted RNA polymerase sigma factor